VLRVDEQVVGEISIFQKRNAPAERRPQHEAIVGFSLDDVPDTNQFRAIRELLQLVRCIGRLQIDPANHSCDEGVSVRQLEQPSGFIERLPRLYGDANIDGCGVHLSSQLRRKKIPPKRGHRIVYPVVFGCGIPPEMLMRVYSHLIQISGTGVPPEALDW
jgi:hypothetical protein